MKKLSITAASHVGCIRSNNEDMILVWDKFIRNDTYRTEIDVEALDRFTIALADGMGGHNAGEVASQEALSSLHFYLNDLPVSLSPSELNEAMVAWLESINKTIASRGFGNPSLADMGTTLVGLIFYGHKVYWVNCGDSRLYQFRDGKLTQLSTDHSLNNMLGTKKHSNIITNCIGGGCKSSYIDMFEFTGKIQAGDTYVLCSDGLNDRVDDEEIEELLASGAEASRLCKAAVDAGGFDNVSVCVINVE